MHPHPFSSETRGTRTHSKSQQFCPRGRTTPYPPRLEFANCSSARLRYAKRWSHRPEIFLSVESAASRCRRDLSRVGHSPAGCTEEQSLGFLRRQSRTKDSMSPSKAKYSGKRALFHSLSIPYFPLDDAQTASSSSSITVGRSFPRPTKVSSSARAGPAR